VIWTEISLSPGLAIKVPTGYPFSVSRNLIDGSLALKVMKC